jgi:Protein phosphatase 2C
MNATHTSCWRVVSASMRGTSHEKSGKPCQDAHSWEQLLGNVLVAAVADGAGSSAHSEVGSEIATRIAVSEVAARLVDNFALEPEAWQIFWTDVVNLIRTEIQAEADRRQVQVRELATTILLSVVTPEFVSVAQIGDGAIVIRDRQGKLVGLTTPPIGEYANETVFVTSPNALDNIQIQLWHGEPAQIAMFSDGLQMLALQMPAGIPHQPFFTPLFNFIAEDGDEQEAKEQLLHFLGSPRITERADDDLTLLLANLPSD